ncbi:oxidoreductase oxidoreductase [Fimicolochytrium jonesii]|uniref:oxidoreductase oxidoreductase n=1 Tax=Fimicolochytrium jonesii TaxID=1396493 RepID=UPI0022FE9397|nr:oxidoreductase oxidoreductase [Fimicolochytrium jonesii]KAI8822252.1 oxidoreductase oxidoreductase [Fimicolochytrium jonesii]
MTPEDLPPWTDFFNEEELQAALKIFRLYAEREDLLKHAQQNPEIATLFALAQKTVLPSEADLKERKKRRKQTKKNNDQELLAVAGIRQMRKVKMVGYTGGSVDLPFPPRIGTPEANERFAIEDEQRSIQAAQSSTGASTATSVTGEDDGEAGAVPPAPPMKKLTYNRSCHVCGVHFRDLHHFYDQLCPVCAELNYTKRFSEADMRGRVCIVTGARVKIGYCIALKLLRMGATVIVTTRFPHDAANRFAREPDHEAFAGRISIYGLDFRDIAMLHHFCRHVQQEFKRLDVIINNAAQTVRKPPAYYEHLITGEAEDITPEVRKIVDVVDVYRSRNGGYVFRHGGSNSITAGGNETTSRLQSSSTDTELTEMDVVPPNSEETTGLALPAAQATAHLQDVNASAALSQVALLPTDASTLASKTHHFPPGLYDRDDQQLDLRRENSWTQEIGQISTIEMMECHVINTFAPWVLISELKGLMERTGPVDGAVGEWDKFVVNVSAMEGQFYRNKTIFHPHTNMAKAALNMMTRTSSSGLAAVNIFMTAVDTGWITDENPVDQWHKREHQPPPLDEWDAAMRVIDPVLMGVRGEERLWGCFLKNYRSTRW